MKKVELLNDADFCFELRRNFLADGFIHFPGFLHKIEIRKLSRTLDLFISEKVPQMPKEKVYYEERNDRGSLKQIQHLFDYVPFFHKMGIRPHKRTDVLGFSQGIVDFGTEEDLANEVYYILEPGDLLVHHALTIHRADKNSSKYRSRKALGFIYYAEKAREDKVAHKAF